MTTTAEIIAIGNELLIGDVQDTNTHWLCRQITGLGGHVRRCTMLPDELAVIVQEIQRAVERGSHLIITSGGLGPTDDDLTLQAVARAAGVPLAEHPQALEMVRAKYAELARQGYVDFPDLTPARRKMASLPHGATPLANPVGAAPGVVTRIGSSVVVSLPGVPAELRGIFTTSLQPLLQELFGAGYFAEEVITTDCGDESVLAPIVRRIAAAHPQVYVKSRARRFGPQVRLRITLSASGAEQETVRARLGEARRSLIEALTEAGISIIESAM